MSTPTIKPSVTPSSCPTRKPSVTSRSGPTRKRGIWKYCTSPLAKWLWHQQWVWWQVFGYKHVHITDPKGRPPLGYATNSEQCIKSPPSGKNWLHKVKYQSIGVVRTSWEWHKWVFLVVIESQLNGTFLGDNWLRNINCILHIHPSNNPWSAG